MDEKRTHVTWVDSFFALNLKKHPERAFEIWNALLDEFPPELTLSKASIITDDIIPFACKYAPLEFIKNLKDDAFFDKLYGNIDYDFCFSLKRLLVLLMENKEMELLEKLVERAKTLFNDESKEHIKGDYRSFLELESCIFELPAEICDNDESIRRVFDIFMK